MYLCFNMLLNTTTAYTKPVLSSGPLKFQDSRGFLSYRNLVTFSEVNSSTSLNSAISVPSSY